jgi:surfeit locus 1 family protein
MALTARLGFWQLDRAAQKNALQQQVESRATMPPLTAGELAANPAAAAEQHQRRIRLSGRWLARDTVFLDNRQMNGLSGFFVLTPLVLADGRTVVVQRGWAPRNSVDRTKLPPVVTPEGDVTVIGHVAPLPSRLFEFAASGNGLIRQNLDLDAFAREAGRPLAPLSIVEDVALGPAADGLLRQWPHPAADVFKHYGYAFQWFAMCVLMAGLYVWFQLLRPRFARRSQRD